MRPVKQNGLSKSYLSIHLTALSVFQQNPLAFAAGAGIVSIILAFFLIATVIIKKIMIGDPVQGWASTICVILFLGGVQLFTIGILGLYVAKIYIEVKQRPIYIAKEEA